MKLIFRYLKPYWPLVIIAPVFMLLEVFMDLMQPALMARIIDTGIKTGSLPVILSVGSRMLIVAFIGLVGGIGCTTTASLASTYMGADLRNTLFRQIQGLSLSDLESLETGNLITLLTNDVVQLEEMSGMMLRIVVRAPLLVAGSFIMAVIISPSLSLVLFVLAPMLVTGFILIVRKAYPFFSRVQACLDKVNTGIGENLSGKRLVKAFVREEYEIKKFGQVNDAFIDTMARASKTIALIHPVMQILLNMGIVFILWSGGLLVRDSSLSIGKLIAFINYLTQLLWSLMMISNILMRFSRAQVSAARIGKVFTYMPEMQPGDKPVMRPAPVRELEFRNVCFAYNSAREDPVLNDISFTVQAGQTLAILGATGSGKTTLACLIPAFYRVTSGAIYIDGEDIRRLSLAALRKMTAIVHQETILFRGTIRRNILYGADQYDTSYTEKESVQRMTEAAKTACIADFIGSLPGQYDTDINQKGLNLSGGQKQRIAIARALAARTQILILDDATSSVDIATERTIHETLSRNAAGQIRIVIAQRISTVLAADLIIILDNGRIAGAGTHGTLLACNPVYQDIYASQYGKGEV